MKHALYSIAGLFILTSPYSCQKPTLQESYAHEKVCHAVLDTSLKVISPVEFGRTGLDPSLVRVASQNMLQAAYSDGRNLGMGPDAIAQDVALAGKLYLKSHARPDGALRKDVNGCLGDYYGRPND